MNGERLNPLSTDDLQYFETRFFLVPGTGTVYVDAKLSVIRQRAVGDGFHEELTILNHDDKPVDLTVRIEAGCDFADLFEVKDALEKKGKYVSAGRGRPPAARLRARHVPARDGDLGDGSGEGRRERPDLHDHGRSRTASGRPTSTWSPRCSATASGTSGRSSPASADGRTWRTNLGRWLEAAPRLECDSDSLKVTYRRSLVDLAALRFSPPIARGRSLPAAGLPWFMTMFGRDSIFTSLQALPFTPELAATTLLALGEWQGTRVDDFRDEDPGRILHEMRYGEMTAFEERPHSPYYGCADATPLYVVLLDEYERWTGDRRLVRDARARGARGAELDRRVRGPDGQRLRLVPAPQRGDRPREPVLEGLLGLDLLPRRQAARASRGRPASCRATPTTRRCAAPGSRARSGRTPRSPTSSRSRRPTSSAASTATSGSRTASTSRSRSTPTGNQVDALASNNGHLLWSGIVDKSKAKAVARHLLGPRLFSGWGVRTLAEGEGRYNPIGYHVGTVWPFDNSFIAWGLRRYGFKEEAAQIAAGILDAAEFFDGRLPEAFGGYERERDEVSGAVPDRLQPAGLVDRRAAPAPADDARPRAARRAPHRRPRAPARASASSSCSTSPGAGAGSTPSAAGAWISDDERRARRAE